MLGFEYITCVSNTNRVQPGQYPPALPVAQVDQAVEFFGSNSVCGVFDVGYCVGDAVLTSGQRQRVEVGVDDAGAQVLEFTWRARAGVARFRGGEV